MEKQNKGYQHRLAKALGSMPLAVGTVGRVTVQHDDGCGIWDERGCSCVPEISISHGDDVAVVDTDGSVSKGKRQ
jgi:hypothetical protein